MDLTIPGGLFLFGQEASVAASGGVAESPQIMVWAVLTAAVILGAVVAIVWLGIRSEQRKRELEHAERMRAIEAGRPLPGDLPWWTPGRVAVAIGAGVPLGAFAVAGSTVIGGDIGPEFVWPSAGAVGVAAVICGTVLAARLPHPTSAPEGRAAKPYVDPDAFEVAGHHHA